MREPTCIDLQVVLAIHDATRCELIANDAACVTTFLQLAAGDLAKDERDTRALDQPRQAHPAFQPLELTVRDASRRG